MKSMSLEAYGPGSPFIKALILMLAKEGKTSFLVMSLLGLWPWQTQGGVVSDPAHLHVIAIDQDCLDRIVKLMELAGVPAKTIEHVVAKIHVLSMRDDVAKVLESTQPYNHHFINALKAARQDIIGRIKAPTETHAVVMSSFSTMAKINERCLFGAPTGISDGKGYGSKDLWTLLQGQAAEIQNLFQVDRWHMFWEGHVAQVPKPGGQANEMVDTLQVHGSAKNWPANTSHNLRVVRETVKWKDPRTGKSTGVDQMYVNPKPSYSFIPSGGRGVGGLAEKEYCLAKMMMDMGYQVGGWKP